MALPPIGGAFDNARFDNSGVMALRAQILARNAALSERIASVAPASQPGGFNTAITDALAAVNNSQARASTATDAFERGDNVDIAGVMVARQKAAIGFEATLQVRNKLLTAYRDIMSMPI
jgi:flagellar hook-basal body complex protein FliE